MTHTNTLTPNAPRRQQGLRADDTAVPPVALRQMATGETEATARDELPDVEHLIPTPAPEQARGEARIFHALITAYGRHRPTLTGGPFGIRSLTPRTDELVVRIAPAQTADHPAAHALCHIAGLTTDPLLVQAAEHALDVATRVLADPAHASVYAAGGWAGSCRTYPEGTVHGSNPCLPPGAEAVTDLPEETLQRLGQHFSSRLSDTSLADLASAGREELVHLLDWALAVATRPANRPDWTRDRTDGTLQHTQPLPDHDGTLTLTATTTGVYRVSLDALGLSDLADEDDTVEWEGEAAPSQSAAVLLAEHAVIEAAVCLPFQREHRKQRLLLPAAVSADPTIRSVIAGADYVLGFFTFASVLGRLHERVCSTQGVADGHWRSDPPPDGPATLTALISDWCALPSPHHGEAANTATVDSPTYLRHLAAHRAALDPFVTRYLAAADTLPGARTFEERHLAAFADLRTTDLSALARTEIRPVGERLLHLVRSMPQDPAQLTAWYEHHLDQA
ncbi:hypothetical protein ACFY2J_27045 [Streptomyces collinus]|uniref:hypothetical protein n=1 Tax=Streptomyces collinus TaxID=42684 RepID=UPI003676EAB8